MDGRLQPGTRLTEETFAADLGISRTPVREAFRILQTEGLLTSAPYHGSTVRTYDETELLDIYEMRALLEGDAARRAALRRDAASLAELEESCERFVKLANETDEDLRQIVEENLRFHNVILEMAGSPRLAAMVRQVIVLPLVYKSYIWFTTSQKRVSEHTHRQLVNAITKQDSDRAQLIMREHVYEARDVLIAHIQNLAASEESELSGGAELAPPRRRANARNGADVATRNRGSAAKR
jgi:DNA-binding GntR family transcriptional regulator